MTNAVYPKAKELMLGAGLNLLSATVQAILIDTSLYTYSAAHQYLSDIPAGARVGTPQTLTGKSITNGVFDAADPSWSGLSGTPSIEAVALVVNTGTESTSPLLAFFDTATGLPISSGATGGTVAWDNGASRIFAV